MYPPGDKPSFNITIITCAVSDNCCYSKLYKNIIVFVITILIQLRENMRKCYRQMEQLLHAG